MTASGDSVEQALEVARTPTTIMQELPVYTVKVFVVSSPDQKGVN